MVLQKLSMGIYYGYGFYPDKIKGEGFFISAVRKTGKPEEYLYKKPKKNKSQA